MWPRAVGWAVFGFLLGTAEGISNRDKRKASYGAVGGLLGGLIGGSAYERASQLLRTLTQDRDLSLTVGGALGLIILGACIGSLIALAEDILKTAWLKGLRGMLEGRTLLLSKALTTLGRAETCDILIPGDAQVADHHADIRQTPQGHTPPPGLLARPRHIAGPLANTPSTTLWLSARPGGRGRTPRRPQGKKRQLFLNGHRVVRNCGRSML